MLISNELQGFPTLSRPRMPDILQEKAYDDIVQLAALICTVPIALIRLIGNDHQWFKSTVELSLNEASFEEGFCSYAVSQGADLFIVPDTLQDKRFSSNPWVVSYPYARFYAGVPMVTQEGRALGTLCVMDRIPRELNKTQQNALRALSRRVIAQIEMAHQMEGLRESELCFRTFLDNSSVLVSIKDESGRYLYANHPLLRYLNMSWAEVIGKTDRELWPDEIARTLVQHDRSVLATGKPETRLEKMALYEKGVTYWQFSRFVLQGQPRRVGNLAVDVTQAKLYEQQLMKSQESLKRSLDQLEILSVTDGLTGLYNRRAFEEKLREEFERARRYKLPMSLLLLDADRFKEFNDSLGHPAGDNLLQQIARILKQNARKNDIAARYGGDEFAVILPNTGSRVAFNLAERLRRAARTLWRHQHQMSISIGVSALRPEMSDPLQLIVAADNALYDAKRKGRNRVSDTIILCR